jgi:hypothetical protein
VRSAGCCAKAHQKRDVETFLRDEDLSVRAASATRETS